jgi:endonuclease/exonuclease/phosphatase family metal-dependent hydrolase
VVINVYISINPVEKANCWRSILNLKESKFSMDCIIVGDFNVVRNSAEKRGLVFGPRSLSRKDG